MWGGKFTLFSRYRVEFTTYTGCRRRTIQSQKLFFPPSGKYFGSSFQYCWCFFSLFFPLFEFALPKRITCTRIYIPYVVLVCRYVQHTSGAKPQRKAAPTHVQKLFPIPTIQSRTVLTARESSIWTKLNWKFSENLFPDRFHLNFYILELNFSICTSFSNSTITFWKKIKKTYKP